MLAKSSSDGAFMVATGCDHQRLENKKPLVEIYIQVLAKHTSLRKLAKRLTTVARMANGL